MANWLRRLRGAVGMGLTWAGLWSVVGAVVAVLPGTLVAPYPIPLEWLVRLAAQSAAQFAALGFVGGATFSGVLAATEGRRGFGQLSLPRFAILGTLGGLAMWALRGSVGESVIRLLDSIGMPGPTWVYGISGGLIVLVGAGSAVGTLVVARRVDDRELLEAGEGMAEAGRIEPEVPQLLGGAAACGEGNSGRF